MRSYIIDIVNIINYTQYYITLLKIQVVPREKFRKECFSFSITAFNCRQRLLPCCGSSYKCTSNTAKAFFLYIDQQASWSRLVKRKKFCQLLNLKDYAWLKKFFHLCYTNRRGFLLYTTRRVFLRTCKMGIIELNYAAF